MAYGDSHGSGGRRFGGGGGGGFNRGGGGGFRRDFGGPREMHKITCSECGNEGTVPFKPRQGTPVYCKDCFAKRSGRSSFGDGEKEEGTSNANESSDDMKKAD